MKGESELSEGVVREAVAGLDWKSLKRHLERCELDSADMLRVGGIVRRSSVLVKRRKDRRFEQKRNGFRDKLVSYALDRFDGPTAEGLKGDFSVIELAEKGYDGVLSALRASVIGKRKPEVRAAAMIARACEDFEEATASYLGLLKGQREFWAMSGGVISTDDGEVLDIDEVAAGLSRMVAATLLMEAHEGRWFEEDVVVLPNLPEVDPEAVEEVGEVQVLAVLWGLWQRVEARARFLGGELRASALAGEHVGGKHRTLIRYVPPEGGLGQRELYDYLANRRVKERFSQSFLEMVFIHRLEERGVGIRNAANLPPEAFVSGGEMHAVVALSEVLGYEIASDMDRPGGLRLIEWVRGYAVLQEIVNAHMKQDSDTGGRGLVRMVEDELVGTLQRCGLTRESAGTFIERVSLGKRSKDMFDCPVVRVRDGAMVLFGPALSAVNITVTLLSRLAYADADLGRKGKAFERAVRRFFRGIEMEAAAFKFTRGGEEFEFDAVVPWNEYLFVFECKNRSLSGDVPAQVYYFDLEVKSAAKQARRLADALERNRDVVAAKFGAERRNARIVPCVVHSMPYSRGDDLDGVHFTDYSALARFFEDRYLRVIVPHRVGPTTVLHRTAVKDLWKADSPTPEAFLWQLAQPLQLELLADQLEVDELVFSIAGSIIVWTLELGRNAPSLESLCETVGVDAGAVRAEIAKVGGLVEDVRRSRDADGVRAELDGGGLRAKGDGGSVGRGFGGTASYSLAGVPRQPGRRTVRQQAEGGVTLGCSNSTRCDAGRGRANWWTTWSSSTRRTAHATRSPTRWTSISSSHVETGHGAPSGKWSISRKPSSPARPSSSPASTPSSPSPAERRTVLGMGRGPLTVPPLPASSFRRPPAVVESTRRSPPSETAARPPPTRRASGQGACGAAARARIPWLVAASRVGGSARTGRPPASGGRSVARSPAGA